MPPQGGGLALSQRPVRASRVFAPGPSTCEAVDRIRARAPKAARMLPHTAEPQGPASRKLRGGFRSLILDSATSCREGLPRRPASIGRDRLLRWGVVRAVAQLTVS